MILSQSAQRFQNVLNSLDRDQAGNYQDERLCADPKTTPQLLFVGCWPEDVESYAFANDTTRLRSCPKRKSTASEELAHIDRGICASKQAPDGAIKPGVKSRAIAD
jgi:hypothetical protein